MNCQCFLALLFFIKLVAAVSGTIVQADDHFANHASLLGSRMLQCRECRYHNSQLQSKW
jgi:hypothetical protein